MLTRPPRFVFLAFLLAPLGAHAATPASQQAEYEQIRKIALRDPKVRAAYAEADRKLEAKILQIDPALESYLRHRGAQDSTPTSKPATKTEAAAVKPFRRAHTVAKGETLGSIAIKYGVSVTALKTANQITDEKRLAVGHVLAIPNGKDSAR